MKYYNACFTCTWFYGVAVLLKWKEKLKEENVEDKVEREEQELLGFNQINL